MNFVMELLLIYGEEINEDECEWEIWAIGLNWKLWESERIEM